MSKECPSCHRECNDVWKCVDCGRMFCDICGNSALYLELLLPPTCPKCVGLFLGRGEKVSRDIDDDNGSGEASDDSNSSSDYSSSEFSYSLSDYSSTSNSSSESSYSSSEHSLTSSTHSFWAILMFTLVSAGIWFVVSYIAAQIIGGLYPIWRVILGFIVRLFCNSPPCLIVDEPDTWIKPTNFILDLLVYSGCGVIIFGGILVGVLQHTKPK